MRVLTVINPKAYAIMIDKLLKLRDRFFNNQGGQLMLTTVLILGGAMIGASLIAGFLTTQSIRQSTLAADSAKAIFAADAGLDAIYYQCVIQQNCPDSVGGSTTTCTDVTTALENGSCYVASYTKDPNDSTLFTELDSVGYSDWKTKLVARTLLVTFK